MSHRHSMLPPPPAEGLSIERLHPVRCIPANAQAVDPQRQEAAEQLCEEVILMASRADRRRRYKLVERTVALVAAGWSFEDIDAANDHQRPGMSARQLRTAEKATTVRPNRLNVTADVTND